MDIAPKTAVNPLAILLDNEHQLDTIYRALMRVAILIDLGTTPAWWADTAVSDLRPIIDTLKEYRYARDGQDQY